MADKDQIDSLLNEAEVYHAHGFYKESKEKYSEILKIIKSNKDISADKQLFDSVNKFFNRHIHLQTGCRPADPAQP